MEAAGGQNDYGRMIAGSAPTTLYVRVTERVGTLQAGIYPPVLLLPRLEPIKGELEEPRFRKRPLSLQSSSDEEFAQRGRAGVLDSLIVQHIQRA